MHLRHLETIEALLRAGSFNGAAEWLGLSPAQVEASLQELERQSGILLFARSRGRLQPTPECKALRPGLSPLFDTLDQLDRLMIQLREQQGAPLRVGCTPPLAYQLLPHSLAALKRRLHDTHCVLASHSPATLLEALLLDRCDLGLALEPVDHKGIRCVALAQGKVQLLAPHGWLPSRQRHIGLQALAGQGLIGLDAPDPLSRLLESKLQKQVPPPRIQIRVQTYQMMRAMVEAGEGLALVDPFTAAGAKAAGLDVSPVSPAIPVELFAWVRADAKPCAALNTLMELVAEKALALLDS